MAEVGETSRAGGEWKRDAGVCRLIGDNGQTIVLGMLFMVFVSSQMFMSLGISMPALMRVSIGAAGDAASLAGAQNATVTERMDALGNVYSYNVQIDASQAETAAWTQWQADASLLLGARTTSWLVSIDNNPPAGRPPTMTITATVEYDDWPLVLAGGQSSQTMRFQMISATCGSRVWPGNASPWCVH